MDESSFSSKMRNAHALVRMILNNIRHIPRSNTLTIAIPLERATVARDAECHLGLDHLEDALTQGEKSKKIGVCRRVEDNPQDTNELQGSGELLWRLDTYKSAD
jgi:hypothetical protein